MVPFTVVWYAAPAGAQPLGVRHQYASYNWQRPTPYPDQVGEILSAARPWSNAATPPGALGTNHCGTQWTGQLARLSTPQPSNGYDQPSCCNAPSDCQPRATGTPTLDQLDGSGAHSMHVITVQSWWLATVEDATYSYLANTANLSCHGQPRRMAMHVTDTATRTSDFADCALVSWDNATHIGTWYVPLASPVHGGQLVKLHA